MNQIDQRPAVSEEKIWRTIPPPKDGTIIVAVGRVIWTNDISTSVDQFVGSIMYLNVIGKHEGWHWSKDGMTVGLTIDDEVKIDWWLPLPK